MLTRPGGRHRGAEPLERSDGRLTEEAGTSRDDDVLAGPEAGIGSQRAHRGARVPAPGARMVAPVALARGALANLHRRPDTGGNLRRCGAGPDRTRVRAFEAHRWRRGVPLSRPSRAR